MSELLSEVDVALALEISTAEARQAMKSMRSMRIGVRTLRVRPEVFVEWALSHGHRVDHSGLTVEIMSPMDPPTEQGVYFARAVGLVKIGWAKNVQARLRELQTGCPVDLHLLATTPGERTDERSYHRRFCDFRARGEWFRGDDTIRDEIVRLRWGKR